MIEMPQKWYQKSWVIIVLLVVFFPVGLALMWKNHSWKKSIKIVITTVFFGVAIYFFVGSHPPSIESIKLPYQTIEMDVNKTKSISVSLTPQLSDTSSKVNFYSSDESIVRFDDNILTSISEGTAQIYATSKDQSIRSNKVKVTVVDQDLEAKREKAKPVIDKITAIHTSGKTDSVSKAKKAYDALSSDVKPLVTNIGILIAAQQKVAVQTKESTQEVIAKSSKDNSQEATTKPSASVSTEDTKSQIVYIGKTGTKYHKKTCPTLKGKGTAISLSKALAKGRTPCSICNP
jgi:Bacterial Ig-like domain (group 2).